MKVKRCELTASARGVTQPITQSLDPTLYSNVCQCKNGKQIPCFVQIKKNYSVSVF